MDSVTPIDEPVDVLDALRVLPKVPKATPKGPTLNQPSHLKSNKLLILL